MTTTEVTQIEPSPAQKLAASQEARAARSIKMAEEFVIDSNEAYELAGGELVSLKERQAAMKEQRDSITKPAHAAWQAAIALFKPAETLMEKLEGIWKAKMLVFVQEADKKRAIAQAAADKVAAEERTRLQADAEKLQAAAAAAAAEGNADAAAELQADAQATIEEAATVTSTAITDPRPVARGVSTSSKLEGTVKNKRAFLIHTVAHLVESNNLRMALLEMAKRPYPALEDEALWLELWNHDSRKLDNHVKARGKLLNWPGVDVVDRSTMAARKGS